MTKYEAPRYKELGFYVNGEYRQFRGGFYLTDKPNEIAVLDGITDAVRIESEEPKAPAPKAPASRKQASAK
jgi:hypothetical protein